jgi:hypothetical protein
LKSIALSLLLVLGTLNTARAESTLFLEKADNLANRSTLAAGDSLEFPAGFRLEKFNAEKGFAAAVLTGKGERGAHYACGISLAAISEVRFTTSLRWDVASVAAQGDVILVSLKNEQFDDRQMELRCSANAPVGSLLTGLGVKLRELNTYEGISERNPASY